MTGESSPINSLRKSSADARESDGETAPLVSVIVPSFNHARFVVACLESVLTDPYPSIELVVIDDGSSDGSAEIIRRWMDDHADDGPLLRYQSRANRGQTATLNELVRLATGPYIAYLASDDMLFPGGLAARVDYLEAHPDKHAVFGDCEVIDARGQRIMGSGLSDLHGVRKHRLRTNLKAEIIGNWGVPGPVLMYRKRAMLAIGGYAEGHIIEDWYVYLGLIRRDWLGFIDTVVGCYRLHGDNTMLQPGHQVRINRNLLAAATHHLPYLGFIDQYRLFQQMCSIRARVAKAEGSPMRWVWWRGLAGVLKVPVLLRDRLARS